MLVEHTDHTPLRLRQDGGLAQREARVVASLLDLPVAVAVIHAQIAQAAGLLGVVPQGRTDTLLPTAEFDAWQEWTLTEQWAWAARGWREGTSAERQRSTQGAVLPGLRKACTGPRARAPTTSAAGWPGTCLGSSTTRPGARPPCSDRPRGSA